MSLCVVTLRLDLPAMRFSDVCGRFLYAHAQYTSNRANIVYGYTWITSLVSFTTEWHVKQDAHTYYIVNEGFLLILTNDTRWHTAGHHHFAPATTNFKKWPRAWFL